MTSRRSSGSSLVESAVEPTKSQNITVSWRRSAAEPARIAGAAGAAAGDGAGAAAAPILAPHCAQNREPAALTWPQAAQGNGLRRSTLRTKPAAVRNLRLAARTGFRCSH